MQDVTKPNQAPIMSLKDWLITSIILIIPVANIIMLFYWAFSSNPIINPNKRNFVRAQLIVAGVVLSLYMVVIFFLIFFSLLFAEY